MAFDIKEYKIKDIISLDPEQLNNISISLNIDGKDYNFKSDQIASSVIEFIHYFPYDEIRLEMGPVEKELKNFTYGKNFRQLNDYELFNIRNSKFKANIFNVPYELEIKGAGPVALKVSLFLSYKSIETLDKPVENILKKFILFEYGELIENNKNYQEKLIELKKQSDAADEKQARIREEVRREQEEKERKRRELEEMLNSNKPKNNERPFKMY